MSMITELFGEEILYQDKSSVIALIKTLPDAQKERSSYLLHDWAAATGKEVTQEDFKLLGV